MYLKNVIHRDLKPENMLLHNNSLKLSDLSFARLDDKMAQKAIFFAFGTPM